MKHSDAWASRVEMLRNSRSAIQGLGGRQAQVDEKIGSGGLQRPLFTLSGGGARPEWMNRSEIRSSRNQDSLLFCPGADARPTIRSLRPPFRQSSLPSWSCRSCKASFTYR
jgi:hypothetical protein